MGRFLTIGCCFPNCFFFGNFVGEQGWHGGDNVVVGRPHLTRSDVMAFIREGEVDIFVREYAL